MLGEPQQPTLFSHSPEYLWDYSVHPCPFFSLGTYDIIQGISGNLPESRVMMIKLQCILFDLDGTLLDTGPLIHASFEYMFAREMGQPVPWERLHQFWGRPLLEQMKIFTNSREKAEQMVKVYREHNHRYHDELAQMTPGADEILKAMKAAGKAIGVVTSKSSDIAWQGLRLFGLDQYVDDLVGADATIMHKPQPEPVFLALDRLGQSPSDAIMIGDSPYDIEAGLQAGTMTAGLQWTIFPKESFVGREPHLWLNSLLDLKELP